MTLKKWYDFNKEVLNTGYCIIRVLKSGSFNGNDEMLPETLVNIGDAVKMFGEYEFVKLGVGSVPYSDPEDGSYPCLRFVLWAPENK